MYASVLEGGLGGALGVDGGWQLPLPTRPQRYCDPASLVFSIFLFIFLRNLNIELEYVCLFLSYFLLNICLGEKKYLILFFIGHYIQPSITSKSHQRKNKFSVHLFFFHDSSN